MVTVTFIRHGESQDNPRGIWAGWKDAPLSELGMRQAQAAGQFFSGTKIDIIYASPLLRAFATGQAIRDAQAEPKPPFLSNPKLREQHFGVAEGHIWILEPPAHLTYEELFAQNIFPVLTGRDAKFPDGESLNDLAGRAEEAIAECVLPHLQKSHDFHIAIASHGLCISELIAALLRLDPDSRRDVSYTGLHNTAWTRVIVSAKGEPVDGGPPSLTVLVTDVNRHDHLASVIAEEVVENEDQAQARAFFGGAGAAKKE